MATTKTKKPSEKQMAVLALLSAVRGRMVEVTTTSKNGGKPVAKAAVKTLKGKAIEGGKTDRKTVESLAAAGWVKETGADGGGTEGGVSTTNSRYEITDEGKKVRKAR